MLQIRSGSPRDKLIDHIVLESGAVSFSWDVPNRALRLYFQGGIVRRVSAEMLDDLGVDWIAVCNDIKKDVAKALQVRASRPVIVGVDIAKSKPKALSILEALERA